MEMEAIVGLRENKVFSSVGSRSLSPRSESDPRSESFRSPSPPLAFLTATVEFGEIRANHEGLGDPQRKGPLLLLPAHASTPISYAPVPLARVEGLNRPEAKTRRSHALSVPRNLTSPPF